MVCRSRKVPASNFGFSTGEEPKCKYELGPQSSACGSFALKRSWRKLSSITTILTARSQLLRPIIVSFGFLPVQSNDSMRALLTLCYMMNRLLWDRTQTSSTIIYITRCGTLSLDFLENWLPFRKSVYLDPDLEQCSLLHRRLYLSCIYPILTFLWWWSYLHKSSWCFTEHLFVYHGVESLFYSSGERVSPFGKLIALSSLIRGSKEKFCRTKKR